MQAQLAIVTSELYPTFEISRPADHFDLSANEHSSVISGMGQALVCFLCGFSRRNKVVPLSTDNEMPAVSSPVSRCPVVVSDFYRSHLPQEENWPCDASSVTDSSISDLSHGTSMATISLGSKQTISTTSLDNLMTLNGPQSNTTLEGGDLGGSSSNFRRPGLWTPEPQDVALLDSFDFPLGELNLGNALPSLTFGNYAARKQTSEASFSRFAPIAHTSPSGPHSNNAAHSSADVSTSSSRHTRPATPRPRGPMLIKVQPLRRPDSDPAVRVCKHGVELKGDDDADSHEVSCVRCERPQSKGGRMLHQMMQNRKKEKMLKRQRKAEKKRLMEEERERRRLATEAIDSALQTFVELQRQKEGMK